MPASGSAPPTESAEGSVTIVGTAHVSPDSLADVREVIEQHDPDVVAVELCGRRYVGPIPDDAPYAGEEKRPSLRTLVFLPLMQYIQSRAAARRGLSRETTDMGAAIDTAIDVESDLVLLDRDILQTFSRYWKTASVRETLRVVSSIGLAIVRSESTLLNTSTPTDDAGSEIINDYRETTAEKFPAFRTVFLDERDELMAARLAYLKQNGYDTVAVVGAAHKPGIEQALDNHAISGFSKRPPLIDPRPDLNPT